MIVKVGLVNSVLNTLGISELKNARVDHCPQAYGVYLRGSADWSVMYSGLLISPASFFEKINQVAIDVR